MTDQYARISLTSMKIGILVKLSWWRCQYNGKIN